MFLSRASEIERAQRLLNVSLEKKQDLQPLDVFKDSSRSVDLLYTLCPSIINNMHFAGLTAGQVKTTKIRIYIEVVIGLLLALFTAKFIFLVIGAALVALELSKLKYKVFRRAEDFEKDYTALLLSLSSAIKTGQDPLVALCECYKLFSVGSLVRKELELLRASLEKGATEEKAVISFANSIQHPDIGLFRLAFILARKEGSSLSECLQRLAKVTRQRQSFRRKIRGAVAMQKLSANGIAGCAILIGFIQFTANPNGLKLAISDPLGIKLISIGITLVVIGIFWMRRMARSEI